MLELESKSVGLTNKPDLYRYAKLADDFSPSHVNNIFITLNQLCKDTSLAQDKDGLRNGRPGFDSRLVKVSSLLHIVHIDSGFQINYEMGNRAEAVIRKAEED
jgi:hypothetical protein